MIGVKWLLNLEQKFKSFDESSIQSVLSFTNSDRFAMADSQRKTNIEKLNLDTFDLFQIVDRTTEKTLVAGFGRWSPGVSSWVESFSRFGASAFREEWAPHLERQRALFRSLNQSLANSGEFIVDDHGVKLVDAFAFYEQWLSRILKLRYSGDSPKTAWCAGYAVLETQKLASVNSTYRFEQVVLDPVQWCGDPKFEKGFIPLLSDCQFPETEFWISSSSVGLTLEIERRISRLFAGKQVKFFSPGSILGLILLEIYFGFCPGQSNCRFFCILIDQIE